MVLNDEQAKRLGSELFELSNAEGPIEPMEAQLISLGRIAFKLSMELSRKMGEEGGSG